MRLTKSQRLILEGKKDFVKHDLETKYFLRKVFEIKSKIAHLENLGNQVLISKYRQELKKTISTFALSLRNCNQIKKDLASLEKNHSTK